MSEMIDRVTAALLAEFQKIADCEYGRLDEAPDIYIDGHVDVRKLAVVAIEAMRAPTEAQVEAYQGLCDSGGDLRQGGYDHLDVREVGAKYGDGTGYIRNAYMAMIDAALDTTS